MVKKTDVDAMRKSNRPNKEGIMGFVTRIENKNQEILDLKMENLKKFKPMYADRAAIFGEAKEQGYHTKALGKLISSRKALRKISTILETLEETTADEYEYMADTIDMFAEVPNSNAANEEIKALKEQIESLKSDIANLTEEPTKPSKSLAEDVAADAEKPKLKAVK